MKPALPLLARLASQTPRLPWLVIGKGPSFARLTPRDTADTAYSVALNDACRETRFPPDFVHVTDGEVVERCGATLRRFLTTVRANRPALLLPYYPHFGFVPKPKLGLAALLKAGPSVLRDYDEAGLLYYYKSSRSAGWPHPANAGPAVGVKLFSGVAVTALLGAAGVRHVLTVGVDGGREYAPQFSDLKPLENGRASFAGQDVEIRKAAKRYGMTVRPLFRKGNEA